MNRINNSLNCIYYNKKKMDTEIDLLNKGVDFTTVRCLSEFIKDDYEDRKKVLLIPNKILDEIKKS